MRFDEGEGGREGVGFTGWNGRVVGWAEDSVGRA